MTKTEGAIITGFTGVLCCDMSFYHSFVEELLGHPVFTHQLGELETIELIKKKVTPLFNQLCREQEHR